MAQVKMVALRRHPYGVGVREAGEEYEANAQEAKVLRALGWARDAAKADEADEKPAKVAKVEKQGYGTRAMKAKG